MIRRLLGYFLRGCLVLAPLALTLYVIWLVFRTVDQLLPIGIPGLGFVVTVGIVTVVGALTSNVVGKAVLEQMERLLSRVPFVKLVYTSIKDLIGAFVGDKKRFDKPVAVLFFPDSPIKALGFVTRETILAFDAQNEVAVYFPQAYNFAGYLLLVPRERVQPLAVSSTELMAFIVSGGVAGLDGRAHSLSDLPVQAK
jgi:uncharacterized membrane protein